MRNLSEILTELDMREYEDFCLRASYDFWQETEIYGDEKEDEDEIQ